MTEQTESTTASTHGDTANRKNLALLIQLRWIAVVGQIVTIGFVRFGLGIALPLQAMAVVLTALVVLNLIGIVWLRRHVRVTNRALFVALLLDVIAFSAQLYLSGGWMNPFIALYLLQIALAAVLLSAPASWTIVAVTCLAFVLLIFFNEPLVIPAYYNGRFDLHLFGMFVCFALNAALLVAFVTRMNRNLRERDARVAKLQRQATEEDHIVRLGLLASGAAHELGTPLASVSVILGDWQHMPQITRNPELGEDLAEMQAAIRRCKTILRGILLSAGEARGEAPAVTTLHQFLRDIVNEWSERHTDNTLAYRNPPGDDIDIVSDPALRQVVTNLLENAYEASPQWIGLEAQCHDEVMRLTVTDAGPGFSQAMLENFGRPYHSTRSRQGAGLGLFLVVNVIRKLGGTVAARNREEGGAIVTIELPLAALKYAGHEHR
jgi:two-component system sensor histidine kinase RegB